MTPLTEKPKIVFYRQRTFSELFNVTFDFLRENWKPLLKYITLFLLPICMVQGLSMNSFFDGYVGLLQDMATGSENFTPAMIISYGLMLLTTWVGYVLMQTLTYTMMKVYDERKERLVGVTFDDMKPYFWRYLGRVIIAMLVAVGIGILIIMLMAAVAYLLSPWLLLLMIPTGAVLMVPYALVTPLYIFEDCPLGEALKRGYTLGFKVFWLVVGIVLLLSIIVQFVSGFVSMPFSIFMGVKMFLGAQDNAIATGALMTILSYLATVILSYVSNLLMPIQTVGLSYLYSHTVEKEEGLTNSRDIQNFEQMSAPQWPGYGPTGNRYDDIEDFNNLV